VKSPRRSSPRNILANLPVDRLAKLSCWLVKENDTYATVQRKLRTEFAVVVSQRTICEFWKNYCAPVVGQRDAFIRETVLQQWRERLARRSTTRRKGAKRNG